MITVDTTPRLSAHHVIELVRGEPSRSAAYLDSGRWGRWLRPEVRSPGSGHYRRLSGRDASVVLACHDLVAPGPYTGPPKNVQAVAATLAPILNSDTSWEDYFVWHPDEGSATLTDDPAEVVADSIRLGGGRVLCLRAYVLRVRDFADSRA